MLKFQIEEALKKFQKSSESILFLKMMIKGIGFELKWMIYQGKSFEQC